MSKDKAEEFKAKLKALMDEYDGRIEIGVDMWDDPFIEIYKGTHLIGAFGTIVDSTDL